MLMAKVKWTRLNENWLVWASLSKVTDPNFVELRDKLLKVYKKIQAKETAQEKKRDRSRSHKKDQDRKNNFVREVKPVPTNYVERDWNSKENRSFSIRYRDRRNRDASCRQIRNLSVSSHPVV